MKLPGFERWLWESERNIDEFLKEGAKLALSLPKCCLDNHTSNAKESFFPSYFLTLSSCPQALTEIEDGFAS